MDKLIFVPKKIKFAQFYFYYI